MRNSILQVTEKKIKQVKNLNVDPGARGNGNLMTNSMGLNLKSFAPRMSMNEVAVNRPKPAISPDFVFPPGGIPSLHLPSVVVLASGFQDFQVFWPFFPVTRF
jgi:serine/threonine-protein phosphatase 2A regulatory subunit B